MRLDDEHLAARAHVCAVLEASAALDRSIRDAATEALAGKVRLLMPA